MSEMKSITLNGKKYDSFVDKNAVKTINGVKPDANGSVKIYVGGTVTDEQIAQAVEKYMAEHPGSGGGLNATAKALLISILRNGVFVSDQSESITALESALASSGGNDDSGGSGGNGESQTITFAQTGSVLAISGVESIKTITQTGSVLALA